MNSLPRDVYQVLQLFFFNKQSLVLRNYIQRSSVLAWQYVILLHERTCSKNRLPANTCISCPCVRLLDKSLTCGLKSTRDVHRWHWLISVPWTNRKNFSMPNLAIVGSGLLFYCGRFQLPKGWVSRMWKIFEVRFDMKRLWSNNWLGKTN